MKHLAVLLPVPLNTFTYSGDAEIGERVEVEFGKRVAVGYVVGKAEPIEKAKPILRRLDTLPVFLPEIITLTKRISEKIFAPWYRCMECAVPSGYKLRDGATARFRRVLVATGAVKGDEDERVISAVRMVADHPETLTIPDLARTFEVTRGRIETLVRRKILKVVSIPAPRSPFATLVTKRDEAKTLNAEQSAALDLIDRTKETLLMGITGSGKTEVYLQAIARTLARAQSAIVLVPEISLTPQTVDRFRARFGDIVAILHSGLSPGERYDEWSRIREGRVRVVVGARSAVFAPVADLGLIVIDEAHETSYKQSESPRYDAIDVARERAQITGGRIVLGTATPTCEMIMRTITKDSVGIRLGERIESRPLPKTTVVDMREELADGNRSIFSRALRGAMKDTLERKEQAILFLNRRGRMSFILCRTCGASVKCPRCSVSLTPHGERHRLVCHFCNHRADNPAVCPACGSKAIKAFGAGTERIETEARRAFPEARVARMDADTTMKKDSHRRILDSFASGEFDILVGTQMIGKGLDLPKVTLVGIVAAESSLHLPDFRAAERTFGILVQVAGRAGRSDRGGRAILQTYAPEHYAIRAAAAHDIDAFLKTELTLRRAAGMPPYTRIIQWTYEDAREDAIIDSIGTLSDHLRNFPGAVAGPAPAPFERLRGRHRWQVRWIFDRNLPEKTISDAVRTAPAAKLRVALDVDPVDLL